MPAILLIEDDQLIVEAIEKTLSLEPGFRLEVIGRPSEALSRAVELKPDLILLDIRLPGGDGRHILKDLKRNPAAARIPVIFLTGMASEGDRVLGLELGADDYVSKPFSALELLARIRAVLRRTSPVESGAAVIDIEGLNLNRQERRVLADGTEIPFQPREFDLLYLLASHPRKVLSRNFLVENSSSYGMPVPTRSIDTHIKNIRKKLAHRSSWIKTVHKFGYRFSPLDDDAL